MSVINPVRIRDAGGDSRPNDGAASAAMAADSREITAHFADAVVVTGEWLAIDQFIAGVLRRAHRTGEPFRSPSEARTILRVAHLFADALERTDLPFDRLRFIQAATEGPSHA
jgi:hypothetical protein